MEITKENIDALNGVLTVKVHPEDYKDKVDGILEEYRKQVKMPGSARARCRSNWSASNTERPSSPTS